MKHKSLIITVLIICLLYIIFSYKDTTKNDNVIYIKEFLSKSDFKKVSGLTKDKNTFMYEDFRYAKPLFEEAEIYDIFYGEKSMDTIQTYLNNKIYPSEFPIEHRIYHRDSSGMRWHKDTLLYTKPQYEAIYTIDNQSKSMTQWKDETEKLHEIWTEPNSLLIVKADGYNHHVTPPLTGEREILKLIYIQDTESNENFKKEMDRFNKFKL